MKTNHQGVGCVYRQDGRNVWMLKFYRGGKVRYQSSHTTDREEAETILRMRLEGEPTVKVSDLVVVERFCAEVMKSVPDVACFRAMRAVLQKWRAQT